MEGIFVRMVLSLAAVLALMAGLLFLVKKFALGGKGSARMPLQIDILGKRSLQPKKSIIVVRVADKVLVVGMSEHGMQTLTELTNEEVQTALSMQEPVQGFTSQSFSAHLQQTLRAVRRGQKLEAGV
jgi:flagellar protein FliO/FliZ